MRIASLIILLSALASTALIFVCLLAGYTTTTLPNVDMFTVNATQLANTNFDNSTGNGCNCVEFVNGTLTINGTSVRNGSVDYDTVALGTSEYYAVYTLNYCEGRYLDNSAVLTHCETPSLNRRFNLAIIVEDAVEKIAKDLNIDLDLKDLDWPNGVTNAFMYVKSAGAALVAFFIVGLLFLLSAVIAAFFGLFTENRFVMIFLLITSIIATLSLAITAGLATAIITTVVNGINTDGDDVGISADMGNWFNACIWIAVALKFVATLTATVQSCTRGRSSGSSSSARRMRRKQDEAYGMPMMPPRYYRGSMPYYMPMGNEDPYMNPYSSRRSLMRDDEYEEFR